MGCGLSKQDQYYENGWVEVHGKFRHSESRMKQIEPLKYIWVLKNPKPSHSCYVTSNLINEVGFSFRCATMFHSDESFEFELISEKGTVPPFFLAYACVSNNDCSLNAKIHTQFTTADSVVANSIPQRTSLPLPRRSVGRNQSFQVSPRSRPSVSIRTGQMNPLLLRSSIIGITANPRRRSSMIKLRERWSGPVSITVEFDDSQEIDMYIPLR